MLVNEAKKTIKAFIKSIIERIGYRVSKVDLNKRKQILDLRYVTTDPIEAVYRAGSSQTSAQNSWVVINVPIGLLRSYPMGFGNNSQYADPFAETVKNYVNRSCVSFEGSVLENYFRVWQPKNAAELLGLNFDEANEELLKAPPSGAVWPWDFDRPERRVQQNNIQDEGWQHCGPVSQDKGREEFCRYQRIVDSIIKNGYQRNTDSIDGDIAGQILLRGSDWRVMISDGIHRFAVLQASGWSNIPVCLRRWPMLIRREDVCSWPNVANSLFDVNSATKIFDRLFDANQPLAYPGCKQQGAQIYD